MKAAIVRAFGSPQQISVSDFPEPSLRADEVLIKVKAADVNYPDLLVISGQYQFKPPLPFVPGKGVAGIVAAVGREVSSFSVGDRVAAQVEYGAFAEKVAARADNVFAVPQRIEFAKAAALGLAYQTAHFALVDRARLNAGEAVLVLGASGAVGIAAVQLARLLGAATIIAGVRNMRAAEMLLENGADAIVDLSVDDLRDKLRDEVRKATTGHGADVVIDPIGGDANAAALRAMAWRGRMVIVGFAAGNIPTLKANYLLLKNIEVSGLQWSDYRERTPELVAHVQREIFAFCEAGRLEPPIVEVIPLAEAGRALSRLQQGGLNGKLVLEIS
jgi:NADPH2:quinone reductase